MSTVFTDAVANLKVQVWLEQVFGDQGVPAYELNPYTVGILHDLMTQSTRQEADTQLLIEDLRQRADEYRVEGKRIEGTLQGVGLSAASLSQSGVMSLRTLANLALSLGIANASNTCFLLAFTKLEQDLLKVEDLQRGEEKLLLSLQRRTEAARTKHAALKRAVEELEKKRMEEQPLVEKRGREIHFIQNKAKEYRPQVKKLQDHLRKVGTDPSISHQALLSRQEDLNKIKQEIEPLKQKLESYHGLPPDAIQAHIKLDEIKGQVAALEAELASNIDMMWQ